MLMVSWCQKKNLNDIPTWRCQLFSAYEFEFSFAIVCLSIVVANMR